MILSNNIHEFSLERVKTYLHQLVLPRNATNFLSAIEQNQINFKALFCAHPNAPWIDILLSFMTNGGTTLDD